MKIQEYYEKRKIARGFYDAGDKEKGRALLDALYEESNGRMDGWVEGLELGNPDVNIRDTPWPREVPEYSAALESAGVTTVTVSSTSTGLMEFIEAMVKQGWKLEGMTYVYANKFDLHDGKQRPALRLSKR